MNFKAVWEYDFYTVFCKMKQNATLKKNLCAVQGENSLLKAYYIS